MNGWKLIVSIVGGLGGIVWVASAVSLKTEQNEKDIEKVQQLQAEQAKAVWTSSVKIKHIQIQVDKIEKTTVKIWDKLK